MDKGGFYKSDLVVRTYDLLTSAANPQISGDVAFYLEAARSFGSPVLELAVGTGRIAWPLIDAGYHVMGLDNAPSMLAAARQKGRGRASEAVQRLDLREADMASFDLDERFPLALIPFSGLHHLPSAIAQRACLDSVHRHMLPGGRVIVDLFDPILEACAPGAKTPNPDRETIDPASGEIIRRRSLSRRNDPLAQTLVEIFSIERLTPDGEVIEIVLATHELRWVHRQEMIYLFELTGFEVEACYGDFERGPPAYGERQIWIARSL